MANSEDVLERAEGWIAIAPKHDFYARQTINRAGDLIAALAAEVEKLRADVVWAVRHGGLVIPGSFTWVKDIDEVDDEDDEYRVGEASVDGTDASLLSAVRRAREQNNA